MPNLFLGIDTSNYKTSVAITDIDDNIVFERSEFLEVEQGARGLRQSVAFFKQSNALPLFIEDALNHIDAADIRAIAVSSRPRRVEGSYMPVFLAGLNAGIMLSSALKVPMYEFSHQEGHAHAILTSAGCDIPSRCIMYHLSGGTTEILECTQDEDGYSMQIIGGTKDISFGQLLDRVGVKLGYSFPSGAYLDEIAKNSLGMKDLESAPKVKHDDGFFNLSGLETKYLRRIDEEDSHDSMVSVIFRQIANLIYDTSSYLSEKTVINEIYISGGVAASYTVRELIKERNNKLRKPISITFGDSKLSGDNAVGISRLGRLKYISK